MWRQLSVGVKKIWIRKSGRATGSVQALQTSQQNVTKNTQDFFLFVGFTFNKLFFSPLPLSYNIQWIFTCYVHYSFSIDLKIKEKRKKNILQMYGKKKKRFPFHITEIRQQRKQYASYYVAYVQESPETANPSISSLRVSCLLSIYCKSPVSLHTR